MTFRLALCGWCQSLGRTETALCSVCVILCIRMAFPQRWPRGDNAWRKKWECLVKKPGGDCVQGGHRLRVIDRKAAASQRRRRMPEMAMARALRLVTCQRSFTVGCFLPRRCQRISTSLHAHNSTGDPFNFADSDSCVLELLHLWCINTGLA
jgi:hypothetical protein